MGNLHPPWVDAARAVQHDVGVPGGPMLELRTGDVIAPSLALVRPLGRGGMGHVWVAEHSGLRTQVVVKFMSEELAANHEARTRFAREAAAAAQVKSPHVVHISDYGIATNGLPYIAMELLEGRDLSQLMSRGPMSPQMLSQIVTQVARALMRAHEKQIVHRDIKPENIFLVDVGGGEIFAKVLDFGVAKSALAEVSDLTTTGTTVGTPVYMSPEQILADKRIDHRSDLWSLGVLVFEALTGVLPFRGDTVGAISVAICSERIPRPSDFSRPLGTAFDAWFAKACARDPAARFASAKEMADELAAVTSTFEPVPPSFDGSATQLAAARVPEDFVSHERAPTAGRSAEKAAVQLRPTTSGATAHTATASEPPGRSSSGGRWVVLACIGTLLLAAAGTLTLFVRRVTDRTELERPEPVRAAGAADRAGSTSGSTSAEPTSATAVASSASTLPSATPPPKPSASASAPTKGTAIVRPKRK